MLIQASCNHNLGMHPCGESAHPFLTKCFNIEHKKNTSQTHVCLIISLDVESSLR
jgi:hypothetical protein